MTCSALCRGCRDRANVVIRTDDVGDEEEDVLLLHLRGGKGPAGIQVLLQTLPRFAKKGQCSA